MTPEISELLDTIESMARQHCYTHRTDRDYNNQVAGTLVTDSGGLSAEAEVLRLLAKYNRFRIVQSFGRAVVGYWPENDPNRTKG